MKRKWFVVWLCFCFVPAVLWGRTGNTPETNDSTRIQRNHSVNFGVKGGFTSSLFLISDFSIIGVSIDEIQNNYKIGYFASLFMRINFGNHFLQPEVSYNINRCNITFNKPLTDDAPVGSIPSPASITTSIHSIDVPVIYGYNFIKEGPYSLAVFGGPKIRYIWNKKSEVVFENFDQQNIQEKLNPFNLSFTLGVAVNISRIFFDFRYDIGLHNMSKRISYEIPADGGTTAEEAANQTIHFHRRDNVLSFSLGVLF